MEGDFCTMKSCGIPGIKKWMEHAVQSSKFSERTEYNQIHNNKIFPSKRYMQNALSGNKPLFFPGRTEKAVWVGELKTLEMHLDVIKHGNHKIMDFSHLLDKFLMKPKYSILSFCV